MQKKNVQKENLSIPTTNLNNKLTKILLIYKQLD